MREVLVQREHVRDVSKFFAELGGLHDATVLQVLWTPSSAELHLSVDDLGANFVGLPGHDGVKPATLVFGAVSWFRLSGEAPGVGRVKVFDVACSREPNAVTLLLSPAGRLELEFETLALLK